LRFGQARYAVAVIGGDRQAPCHSGCQRSTSRRLHRHKQQRRIRREFSKPARAAVREANKYCGRDICT
jgi:hypothetical protein